jgi:hypothetical protein
LEKLEEKSTKGEGPEEKLGKLEKTGLAEIDRWLESPDVSKLAEILRCESRLLDGKKSIDKGFKDRQEVKRYVCMLASTISSESEKQDTGGASDQSLRKIGCSGLPGVSFAWVMRKQGDMKLRSMTFGSISTL